MDGQTDGQTDKVVTWWVQGTWEEVVQGPGGGKESAYFPGLLRNGGLALKTQGTTCRISKNGHERCITDKKENEIFLMYKEIQKGSVAVSYMSPHIWLNIWTFSSYTVLGRSPSSYITLQPISSEFSYI